MITQPEPSGKPWAGQKQDQRAAAAINRRSILFDDDQPRP